MNVKALPWFCCYNHLLKVRFVFLTGAHLIMVSPEQGNVIFQCHTCPPPIILASDSPNESDLGQHSCRAEPPPKRFSYSDLDLSHCKPKSFNLIQDYYYFSKFLFLVLNFIYLVQDFNFDLSKCKVKHRSV